MSSRFILKMHFNHFKPEIHANKGKAVPAYAKKAYGAAGIAPPILNLGIRWSYTASFTPWLLYLWGKLAATH